MANKMKSKENDIVQPKLNIEECKEILISNKNHQKHKTKNEKTISKKFLRSESDSLMTSLNRNETNNNIVQKENEVTYHTDLLLPEKVQKSIRFNHNIFTNKKGFIRNNTKECIYYSEKLERRRNNMKIANELIHAANELIQKHDGISRKYEQSNITESVDLNHVKCSYYSEGREKRLNDMKIVNELIEAAGKLIQKHDGIYSKYEENTKKPIYLCKDIKEITKGIEYINDKIETDDYDIDIKKGFETNVNKKTNI